MADSRNRPDSKKATNDWLTPPELVEAAGPFDLDPCAFTRQPWRTAAAMVTLKADKRARHEMVVGDGLKIDWSGHGWGNRVFCNPPWDDPLPWAEKMAAHGDGMLLTSAKSTDTRWGQRVLESADAILFFKGRLLYHYPNGDKSASGWTPSMLAAYGPQNVEALARVRARFHGVIMLNSDKETRNV